MIVLGWSKPNVSKFQQYLTQDGQLISFLSNFDLIETY